MNKKRFSVISLVTALVLLGAIRSEAQPANDMFTNAQVIVPTWNSNMMDTAGSITVPRPAWIYNGEANLVGATLEPGEPNHAGANGIASVWFTYTAPAAGELRIVTTNASTVVASYTGTNVANLTATGSSTTGYLSISTTAGTTYQIAFTCPGNTVYGYPFSFYFFPPPANDNFANAATIPNTYTTTNFAFSQVSGSILIINHSTSGYTLQATVEAGEEGGSGTSGAPLRTVWYSFVAPANGYFSARANCSIDQYLDVGQGTPANFTNVTSSSMTTTPSVTRMLVGGQAYLVRVWTSTTWPTWSGLFTMNVLFYPGPLNDNWTNSATLPMQTATTLPYTITYGTTAETWSQSVISNSWIANAFGATREAGEQGNGQSIWYNWTPPSAGALTLAATNIFGGLEFWWETAQSVTSVQTIAGNNIGGSDASYAFTANVGPATNYTLLYGNWNGQEEDAGQITGVFYPEPANDNFAARQTFTTSLATNYITWQGQTMPLSVDQVAHVTGSTLGSTVESGEQNANYGRSIWYSWTPTTSMPFAVNTFGSVQPDGKTPLNTTISVNTGTSVSTLSEPWGASGNTLSNWGGFSGLTPTVGTEYEIQIVDRNNGGITMLSFQQPLQQGNDMFANALPVTLNKQVFPNGSILETNFIYGVSSNATTEAGEPNGGVGTVWYNWTADASGPVTMAMASSFNGNFYVYTGSAVSALTQVASPYTGLDGRSWVSFNAVSNTTYSVQIRSASGSGGAFALSFYEYANTTGLINGNNSPASPTTIYPSNVNAYMEYTATINGAATNATLPPGVTNALTDLINSNAQLNAYFNTNFAGSNSTWWSYTAHSNDMLVVYNTELVASVALRTGLGYDPSMNSVNIANYLNGNENVVFTPQGAYYTNVNSATSFTSRPDPNGAFRIEMNYMYVSNTPPNNGPGSPYNILIISGNGNEDPLVINSSTMQLGTYSYGTFVPFNTALAPGVDYYIALECNGASGNSSYALWINNVLIGTVLSGFDGNSYYPTGLGASGGRVHDLRIYNTSPVNHEAFEIWQGSTPLAVNDDVVLTPCTAGTTYEIRATPLDGQGTYFPFNGSAQNSLGLTVNSYNPAFTNDPSPDPGSVESLQLFGNNPYVSLVPDGGFETPAEGGSGNYYYNPSGGAWNFVGDSGIIEQGAGAWGGAESGYGAQYGFVQQTGYCIETISNMTAGTYNISFVTTGRPNGTANDFNVLIDGTAVGYFLPGTSTSFSLATTGNFTVTAGNHTLEFQGVDTGGGDRTSFMDNVSLNTVATGTGSVNYNNYLDIMDAFAPTSYTVSVWVKVPAVLPMGIIGRTTSAGISSGVWSDDLHITAAGVFEHYTSSGSSGYTVTGTTVIQPNTWYHVAIAAGAGGQELLYVNGVSQGTPVTIPTLSTVGDRWQVGTPPQGYDYFAGELGGLAIYHNTVLTPSQIASLAAGTATPLSFINYLVQFNLNEFWPMQENHNVDDQKMLVFTNSILSWNLPNGTVATTNYITGDSEIFVEGAWGPEWNPSGINQPGGDLLYTFIPPETATVLITDPYSATLSEYLAAFTSLSAEESGSSCITRNWNSISFTATAGQEYWLENGINGQGQSGVNLVLAIPPTNDMFVNATPMVLATNTVVAAERDGSITNNTYTANLLGQNYQATMDSGEYSMGNSWPYVSPAGHTVWWTFTPVTNGWLSLDPTLSSFITEIGIKPTSEGVGGGFPQSNGTNGTANNNYITNYYVTAGTQYSIVVDGSSQDPNGGMGGINLNVTFLPVPPNDNWASPTVVNLTENVLSGSLLDGTAYYTNFTAAVASYNIGATTQSGEAAIGNYANVGEPNRTVWFYIVPPMTGYMSITSSNSTFLTQCGIKTLASGVGSGWNNNVNAATAPIGQTGSIPAFYVTAGTPYMICVDGTTLGQDPGYGIINLELAMNASPPNDDWANATPLVMQTNYFPLTLPNGITTNVTVTAAMVGNNISATLESGEQPIGNYGNYGEPGRTVWWTFVAPFNGTMQISTTNSSFPTQCGIKTAASGVGSGWNNNVNAATAPMSGTGYIPAFYATAGTQYMICVDGTTAYSPSYGFIELDITMGVAPVNNTYPGSALSFTASTNLQNYEGFTLTNVTYTATAVGANTYATASGYTLGNRLNVNSAGQNIWWNFNPPTTGYATISLLGSPFDTLLGAGVFTLGNSPPYGNDDIAPGVIVQSQVTVPVTSGMTNYIDVDGKTGPRFGSNGGVNLTVTVPVPPANDLVANATVLYPAQGVPITFGPVTGNWIRVAGSTTQATNSGENWYNNGWLNTPPNQNVWFAFTPTNTGAIFLSVESPGQHLIAVYYNVENNWVGGCVGTAGATPNSSYVFTGNSGTAYYICVDGTIPGPFVLNLQTFYGAPPNDNFANRIALTNGVTTAGSLFNATRENNEPSSPINGNTVWYSFTPSCSGQLEIDTVGSTGNPLIAAYTGSSVSSLTQVAADNDSDGNIQDSINFQATAGQTYQIQVGNYNGTINNFDITPHLTCGGYVNAFPTSGNFIDYGAAFLSTPGGGNIYYNINGGGYQLFTNGPTITPANLVGVTVNSGGVFTKTAYSTWGNGGFTSVETIAGDGFAECVVKANNQDSMFGLESVYTSPNYQNIDYAIYTDGNGQLRIFEGGGNPANLGQYAIGDRLRVTRAGQVISYHQNGNLIYTSQTPSTGATMHFAASLYQQTTCTMGSCYLRNSGAANETALVFTSGDVNGNVALTAYSTPGQTNTWNYSVQAAPPLVLKGSFPTWGSLTSPLTLSSGANGQVLSKTNANTSWSGVASLQSSSGDCSMDTEDNSPVALTYWFAGLAAGTNINQYNSITYEWLDQSGTMSIFEYGNDIGAICTSVPGDIFRVERRGSTVYYYQNNNLRYTSKNPVTGPLYAALALDNLGSSATIGPATFFQASSPSLTIITNAYGDSTLYTSITDPGTPPIVTAGSAAAVNPPLTVSLGNDYEFGNFRSGTAPSGQVLFSFTITMITPPVFEVTGNIINTPAPITVVSPSGVGGTWTITFPSGSKFLTNTGPSMYFTPQGGGTYTANLLVGTQSASSSTNLYFVVNDLTITPGTAYSTLPFDVYANSTWPMSIYYTYSASIIPNMPYTNAIVLGDTNVTMYFMGTRTGFTPQLANGTYVYSPTLSITPAGTFNNATAFTINSGGATGVEYLTPGSTWQSYNGPFVLNGVPSGTGFIQAYLSLGNGVNSNTNSTQVTFQAAPVSATPASGAVSGSYTVTASTASANASIYWALGSNGNPPATNAITNLYTGPLNLSGSAILTFIARETNYLDSTPSIFTYVAPVPAPSFVTPSCTNNGPLQITVAAGDTNGGVFNLANPFNGVQTATATNGTATFVINGGVTYSLTMTRPGWSPSAAVSNNYYFVMADLGILPSGNCIYSPVSAYFTASSTNTFPTIYYTLDGSQPTTNSTLYTANIAINQTIIITALGVRQGYAPQTITNAYTYMSQMTATPGSGTYNNAFQLVLSDVQATAINYQINGGAWQIYTGPLAIDGTNNGSVVINTSYASTGCPGPTNLISYAFQAATPIITPSGGNIGSGLTVSASDATAGAGIYYAIGDANGNAPSASAITNLYTAPLAVTSTRQFLFQAFKTNYLNSAQAAEAYSSVMPAPRFVTASQTLTNQTAITVASALNTYQSFVLTYPDGSIATNTLGGSTTAFNINEPGTYYLQVFDTPWLPSPAVSSAYAFQVTDLTITPPSENFGNPITVTASGAYNPLPLVINYTTDGTTPTTASQLYTTPIAVTNTTTLNFLGTRQGYAPEYVNGQYNYAPGVAVTPGTSTNNQAITIAMTNDAGVAVIYYRFNGGSWSNYVAPIMVDGYGEGTLTLDAYATTGTNNSVTNTYVYTFQVGSIAVTPASENLSGTIIVTAATATPGAAISYAEDLLGNTALLANATNLYTGPITVTNTACFLFNGTKTGYLSAQASAVYSGQLPAPTFLTPTQTFSNQATISLQSGLPGTGSSWVIIAPDGTTNTTSSASSVLNWNINETGACLVQNTRQNWQSSTFAANSYTFVVQDLSVTPANETFGGNLTVTAQSSISDPAPLVIYCTTDGTVPTTNSAVYSGPLTITNSTTFIWLACRAWYVPEMATNSYSYVPPIIFTPGAGTYSNAITVALSTAANGAAIYYSWDGINWNLYTDAFTLDGISNGAGTLSVYYTNGTLGTTNSYPLNFVVAPLAVSPSSLTLSGPISVTAATATMGAAIDYSINPNTLVTSPLTNLYTNALTVTNRSFLVFQGFKQGYQNSAQVTETYTAQLPAPNFETPNNVAFTNVTAITIEDQQASINTIFTLSGPDGEAAFYQNSQPGNDGWPYAEFSINGSGAYIAWASGQNWITSGNTTNYYSFAVADLVTTPNSLFNALTTVSAFSSFVQGQNPKPLVIYYTLDGSQPTTNSALYTAPVTITNTTTVTWMGTRNEYAPEYITNLYSYVPPVTATPGQGTTNNNSITITLASANGAPISYSLDGIDWVEYNNQPIYMDGYGSGTLVLAATYPGGLISSFVWYFQALPPVVTPAGGLITNTMTVSATPGGTTNAIVYYYAGDLGGDPANLGLAPALYTGPVAFSGSRNLVFESTKIGYQNSDFVDESYMARLPPLQALTSGGMFTNVVTVNLLNGLSEYGGIYYMINPDGTTNTLDSSSTSVNFSVNGTGTYTFYMSRAGWVDSPTTNWSGAFQVADLQINPTTPIISDPNYPITASGDPSNPEPLVIYYTLDGSVPTTSSTLYTGPLTSGTNITINWLATRTGYSPEYATNTYQYIPGATISPTNVPFNNAQQFTITGFSTGTIYYRTNYGSWITYTGPFMADGQTVIDYYASAAQVASLTNEFVATFQVAQPTVNPGGQVASNAINITAASATANAVIYYNTGDINGNPPQSSYARNPVAQPYSGGLTPYLSINSSGSGSSFATLTNVYTNGISFNGLTSETYMFIGRKMGYLDSAYTDSTYTASLPVPVSTLGNNITISAPTVDTITSSIPVQWNYWAARAISSTSTTSVTGQQLTENYTQAGIYPYNTYQTGWINSPTLTISVQFAQPASFTNSLPLTQVRSGTAYTIGSMPNLYEALGTVANAPTMWYNWTAPANGLATIYTLDNSTGASNTFNCTVGQGTSLGNFACLASNNAPVTIAVAGGQEYEMGISQYQPSSTNFQVYLSYVPEPANDNWSNAYSMQSAVQNSQYITGYTLAATTEAGEPAGTNTVWFEYTTYQPGVLAVYPSGGNISLWQGNNVSNLTSVAPYYTTPLDPRWTAMNVELGLGPSSYQPNLDYNTNGVDFNLAQPGTYYVRVSGPPFIYTNEMEFHLRPSNDNFANAIALPISDSSASTVDQLNYNYEYLYTSQGATLDATEPPAMGPATVWFTWQAPTNGSFACGVNLTAQTDNQDPEALLYPCQLDIYQGNSLSQLQEITNLYAPTSVALDYAISGTAGVVTNDSWATATALNGTSATIAFSSPTGFLGTNQWWFTYVSPITGYITLDADNNGIVSDTQWSVGYGSRIEDATQVSLDNGGGGNQSFYAVQNQTYYIIIQPGFNSSVAIFPAGTYSINAQAGQNYYMRLSGVGFNYTLQGWFSGTVGNNNLINAQPIVLTPTVYNNGQQANITVSGSLLGATSEPGENITAANGTVSSHTVWYSVTAPYSGQMTVNTGDLIYNNAYTLNSGESLSVTNLSLIPTVTFGAISGQTYYIQVLSASELPFQLSLSLIEPPVNDMFSNALPLSLSQFYAYNTLATTEPGEQTAPYSIGASIWYSYNPSRDGTLVLSTLPQVASLWQGSNLDDLVYLATEIPTNDVNGNNSMVPITQNLYTGNEYWLAVDSTLGIDMGNGIGQISASYYPFPPNDDFSQATPLSSWTTYTTDNGAFYFFNAAGGGGGNTSSDNYGATAEAQDPPGLTNIVWYSWTAPTNLMVYPGLLTPTLSGVSQWGPSQTIWVPSPTMSLYVYDGTSLQNLQNIASVPAGSAGSIDFPQMNSFFVAQQGETYYIAISGPQGLFDLEWPTVQFPDNDMVANAIPFSSSTGGSLDYGASAALTVYNYGASKESFEQTVFNNSVWTKWNSGPNTVLYVGVEQVLEGPLYYPSGTSNEISVYDDQLNLVAQTDLAPVYGDVGASLPGLYYPVVTAAVQTNKNYNISWESSSPGTMYIQVGSNPLAQTNIANLVWSQQNQAINETFWSASAPSQDPVPWSYYLNLPVAGNVLITASGDGSLDIIAADGAATLIQGGVSNNYTAFMAGMPNLQDLIEFQSPGSQSVLDVLPPVNTTMQTAIPIGLSTSGRNLTAAFTTCNWMAQNDAGGLSNSVWYAMYIPTNGVVQIGNNSFNGSAASTLTWMQTDATSMGAMATANIVSRQTCAQAAYGGILNASATPGYYYMAQSDGPSIATFSLTFTPLPPNESIANATAVTWPNYTSYSNGRIYTTSYLVDVNGSTTLPGEPPTLGNEIVWFTTTMPAAGMLTFNTQDSIFTGNGTLAGLQEQFSAGSANGQLMVTAGEQLWIEGSGTGPGNVLPGTHSMQLVVTPFNDAFTNAINLTNYVPATPTNYNGQQVYEYTFQAPAGFWTLDSNGHYIPNWYCVHATTNLLNVTVSQPDSTSGYYDFGAGAATEMQGNVVVYRSATHYYYPTVWGSTPYDINVPQTWSYYEQQVIYNNLPSYPTYSGLFDLSSFPVGKGISYLYAVPQNILFQSVQSILVSSSSPSTVTTPAPCTYTFIMASPDTVWLTPVFPCAAPQSINITSQSMTQQVEAYDYLATIEADEVEQPGSTGSTWWSLTMPLSGTLTVSAPPAQVGAPPSNVGAAPLLYLWKGTTMSNLQLVASNYNGSATVAGAFNAGDPIMISADIGPAGTGLFYLTLNEGPAVINGTPAQSQSMLPYATVAFENGGVWDYKQPYSLQLDATNLWYQMTPPGTGWLQRLDADHTTVTFYSPVLQDIQLIPPTCNFSGVLTVNVSTEDAIYSPSRIYYTTDGSTPTTNSPVYAAPFALTATTTINLLGIRSGRTPETCTGTYTYQGTVQCSLPTDGSYSAPATFTLSSDNTNGTIIYRITGGNWMNYTGPVTVNGIGSGTGSVYYTQVVNSQTNAQQFVDLQFTANPPQVSPLDGIFQGGNIVISDTTGEMVYYTQLTINQLVPGGYAANASLPANQSTTGTFTGSMTLSPGNYMFQFQTQKTGYQLSSPLDGTYLRQPQP